LRDGGCRGSALHLTKVMENRARSCIQGTVGVQAFERI
jgi:hypothetical protein